MLHHQQLHRRIERRWSAVKCQQLLVPPATKSRHLGTVTDFSDGNANTDGEAMFDLGLLTFGSLLSELRIILSGVNVRNGEEDTNTRKGRSRNPDQAGQMNNGKTEHSRFIAKLSR